MKTHTCNMHTLKKHTYEVLLRCLVFVHAVFFYLLLWVFAWRYYSKHLAQDIKPLLEKLNSEAGRE